MLYRVVLGDWSGDGHSISESHDIEITSGHTVEQLKENYLKNCERFGLTLKEVACEYQDSSIPDGLVEKMRAAGSPWALEFKSADEAYFDEPLYFVMDFIAVGLEPPLEWNEVTSNAVLLVGGYNAQIEKGFVGYGLFGY